MRKKIKKFFIFFFVFFIFLVFSFNSVSAISLGDASIYGTSGVLWDVFGTGHRFNAEVVNNNDFIQYSFLPIDATGSPVAVYCYFSFSGNQYGTLNLTFDATEGSVYYDTFNGLYSSNDVKMADFTVQNDKYVLTYTGEMYPDMSVRAYFTHNGMTSKHHHILNVSFIPVSKSELNIYSEPNTSASDDLERIEGDLIDSTSSYRQAGTDIIGSISNLVSSVSSIGKGMLTITFFFDEFMELVAVNQIVQYSLVIGLIGFILGLTLFIGRAFRGGGKKGG